MHEKLPFSTVSSLSLVLVLCRFSSFRTSDICLIELPRGGLSLGGFTRSDFSRPTPSLGGRP